MVKRLTLILCLLAGGARAAIITTTQDTLLSRVTFTSADEIIIANGDSVYVDSTWSTTTPSLARFFVRQGGALIVNAGKGILVNAVWLGGDAAAPYSSTNGGRLELKAQGYLGIRYSATWPKSITCGANSLFEPSINGGVNGVNCAIVYCDNPATYGLAGIYVENSTASFKPRGVRFRQLYPGGFNGGGIDINASGRSANLTDIAQCYFDTTNVRFITSDGIRIDSCYFRVPSTGMGQAIRLNGSDNDTIWGCQIYVEGVNQGCKGIYASNSTPVFVRGTKIYEDQGSVYSASSYGVFSDGSGTTIIISNDTLYGFAFTLANGNGSNGTIRVDSSVFWMGLSTHESIITHDATDSLFVRSSLFYGRVGGGQSIITAYANSATGGWVGCYYNTFDNGAFGFSPTAFCVGLEYGGSGSATYNNIDFVGNIMLGRHATYSLAGLGVGPTGTGAVTVNLRQYKNNAYKAVYVKPGSTVNYPYTATDSNKVTSAYGFIDSANGDYRLTASSPMLNCGDSTYAIGVFGSAQASKAPFDIGYYQSYTTGTCGGGSSTPTGACCYNYTCAVMTEAQCTALSGVYQGNGTSTCSNCTAPSGTNPSPYSKQLKIASLCYYAPWWTPNNLGGYVPAMRDWAANRYAMLITTGPDPTANVTYMKGINPNLKIIEYQLFGRHASDTAALRAICDTLGYNFKEIILHTDTASVTTTMPTDGSGYGTTQSVTTTADSSPVLFSYWINTQRRVSLNPRDPRSGTVLARRYKQIMDAALIDGIMPDEEQRWTGQFPAEAPILPTDGDSAWARKILNPFGAITNAAYPDSHVVWRGNWAKTLGDSMKSWDKIVIPNGTRLWGAHASQSPYDSGWKVEGRHATVLWGGALLNENHGVYWKDNSTYFRSWMKLAHDVKDSNVDVVLSWIPTGPPQFTCAGYTKPRDKMNFLGFALMCTFPTTNNCNIYFSPKWVSNYNDVYHNWGSSRNFGCSVYTETSDTLWEWSNAWGKYFGVAMSTIDSATSGTDGASQTYKVFKKAFTHPTNGTGDTLGFVAMRFTQGTTYGATSGISVALPGSGSKNWYELIENTGDSAGQGASVQTFWRSTPYTGGSSITILNSQARIFSADTVLANAGFNQSSTGSISIGDANPTEGDAATFTVTISQAQSVLTTFNYSTANGTALSGTDYTATSGSKSIPIGSTSTTITVPTTNRSGCQASRAFTVSITSVSPATLTIIDPTGTGTITDDDCGVTVGKSYKGKIVIKGKVKP